MYFMKSAFQETSSSASSDDFDNDKKQVTFLLEYLRLNHHGESITKFDLLKEMFTKEVDVLMILKTKLDESVFVLYFSIQSFCTPIVLDYNKNATRVLCCIRSHTTSTQLKNI